MAEKNFAVKDVIDLKLIPKTGDQTKVININYLNECQLTLDSEALYALKKGNNCIAFSGTRTGTLAMTAQVIGMDFLAMILGGTYDSTNKKIEVTGDVPSVGYTGEGTFRIVEEGQTEVVKDIKFYSLKAQPSADMTLSATEVADFTLNLDILVDENNKIMDITVPASNPSGGE